MSFDTELNGPTPEIYKPHAVGRHKLGTRLTFPDGRVFRYMKCGGTGITLARVIGAAALDASLDSDLGLQEARTTAEWDAGDYTVRIATSGATSSTGLRVANYFADGYIWVNDEAGQGQMLSVKSHGIETATGSTAGIDITISDESLLTIALSTASEVGLYRNVYKDVRPHTNTTAGGIALGVAPVTVTANYYFWGQTWGPCPVLVGSTLATAGQAVGVLNDTGGSTLTEVAGCCYPLNSTKDFDSVAKALAASKVGYTLMVGTADTECSLVFLTISP
jgi:hypothetical protein